MKKYYSFGGQTVAMKDADFATNGFKYFLSDHLGSVSLVLRGSNILEQQRYLPFGQPRAMSPAITSTDLTYTGQRSVPDTGLMDYKARFYSPSLGRFIQPDTLIPSTASPQSWNRFSYVQNDPVLFNDPTGHVTRRPGDGRDFDDCWIKTPYGDYVRNAMCQVYAFEDEHQNIFIQIANKLLNGIAVQGPGPNILMANESEDDEDTSSKSGSGASGGLPPWTGGKTRGILDTGDEQFDLISGRGGPSSRMPSNTPGMDLDGNDFYIKDHVEAHAAALMREKEISNATLYINKVPCGGPLGCDKMLPHMLPENATLDVYVRESSGWSYFKTYKGLSDRLWK